MSRERKLLEKVAVQLSVFDLKKASDLIGEIQELLAQPEQSSTTRHALDSYWNQEAYQRGYAQAERDSKREPLSDGEITTNTPKTIPIGERLAFHAGIRWAEHKHGIGGGE